MKTRTKRSCLTGIAFLLLATFSSSVFAQTNIDGVVTADNQFEAYLGTVVTTQGTALGSGTDWTSPVTLTTTQLVPGQTNYIQIVARNIANGEPNPAMLIAELNLDDTNWEFANGTQQLLTDTTYWTASATGFGVTPVPLEDLGPNGTAPWGTTAGVDGAASYIWPLGEQANFSDFYFWAEIIPVEADLSITKTPTQQQRPAGTQANFAITVTNAGPAEATNIVITDVLPTGLSYVSDDGGCSEAAGTVTCNIASLGLTSATINLTTLVDQAFVPVVGNADIVNTASVTADETDPTTPNEASANIDVTRVSDLLIRKGDSPDPVIAGDQLVYAFVVTNQGPSQAENVTVVDPLPGGTSFVSSTGGCVELTAGTLTCNLGTLPAGAGTTFSITVDVASSVAHGTTLTNTVTVSSDSFPGPNDDQDTATTTTAVETEAYFKVDKTWFNGEGSGEVPVTINCSTGSVTPATSGSSDTGGAVVFTVNGFDNQGGGTNCTITEEVPVGYREEYSADCAVDPVTSNMEYTCEVTNTVTTRYFEVTKDFTDTNPNDVTVSIACNTGQILDQDFDLADGEKVVFQVENFIDADGFWCEIIETDTNGYIGTYVANSGSPSLTRCYYTGGLQGNMERMNTCAITNTPDFVDVTVGKEWFVPGAGGNEVDMNVSVDVRSAGMIQGGYPCLVGPAKSEGPSLQTLNGGDYCKTINFYGENPADVVVKVKPVYAGTNVYLAEVGVDQYVEVDNTCGTGRTGMVTAKPGGDYSCTFTNTVFFEGIPTLNQYGMALLALLMLGMGMVGFRRFT